MNTNKIKSFAKQARIQLYKGVANQLLFWGFDDKGAVTAEPEAIPGGFTFRGAVYNDVTSVPKWKKLKEKIQKSKESVKDVTEEAAYTWFNRLAAIKILEENNFIDRVLRFQDGSLVPMILQQAKAGQHAVTNAAQKASLQEALLQNDDEKAFAILITQYCNTHPLLKEVFGHLDDYTEILIPNDLLTADGFVAMLNDEANISAEDFTHVELIGWLYQFYIADRKDEVFKGFKANKKARAEDIPAATQIFTPKWIVNYMVENTVGKIYLDYEENSELKSQMKYLVENETNGNSPLIDDINQLTLIDPACGSGHILVTGFEWLYKMYREQGYGAKQAVESILKNNLYGLDLDDRAMQLSRFAILLKAAQQLETAARGEGKTLLGNTLAVLPHVYAFPEEHGFVSEDIATFTNNKYVKEIYQTIDQLRQGKNIGSALKLSLPEEAIAVLKQQYQTWQQKSQAGTLDLEQQAIWTYLKDYVEVALVLTQQYAAVVANPPYMGQKSMNGTLKDYLVKNYPNSKSDLFAVFMEQMMCFVKDNARMGCITMESWMFLSSYENLRKSIIEKYSIVGLGHFGWHILGIAFGTAMLVLEKSKKVKIGEYSYLTIDDVDRIPNIPFEFPKKNNGRFARIPQTNFEKIPGSPIAYWVSEREQNIYSEGKLLGSSAFPRKGLDTGENDLFLKLWTEVSLKNSSVFSLNKNLKWFPYNKGGGYRKWYGNREYLINWKNDGEEIKSRLILEKKKPTIRNQSFYFREGFTWSTISSGGFSTRFSPIGSLFDNGGCTLFANDNIEYFAGLTNSLIAKRYLEFLAPTLNFQPGDISKILLIESPKDLSDVKNYVSDAISISKTDWDSRETSWDFEQNPLLAQQQASLSLAYQTWQGKVSQEFFQLHSNEEELNRIFIGIYGLQDELTPEVALKDITILQDELKADELTQLEPAYRVGEAVVLPVQKEMVISQLLSYLVGCMLGRYRLDKKGLHIAYPNPTEEELANYEVSEAALPFTMQIDEDAILPLMGAACAFPDDAVKRTEDILHRIYGEESHTQNLNFIDDALGMKLDKWMTEKFWPYHISGTQYKKKPIYWLFSSNPKKPQTAAFRVLVYMHRMDGYTVQKIMRNYLHPHQEYLRNQYEVFKENEANLSKPELKTFESLQKQMIELKEYNEVLKQLADLQITFDLDDGVTVNYAKFAGAVAVI
ncbi:N-6 DNA Methylase [Chryseobacterium soldanellicola]|uniref:site-specific DNA-methyltransferase (adenine-specific) n=1 Tax=Chryseobacterium soldanellicola TaxID=311333 RepID=A0A1H1E0N0_9FLAO|nr:BREX-1 system adenine-specific DNA-methyltransferase PglX [Chryseobacterium soldanellicola]SDQ82305.1 N-6 DNA Methylase [Chryseobacterium soldanellicola]